MVTKVNTNTIIKDAMGVAASANRLEELLTENERLRTALDRIQTPEAFFVATSKVDPETFARMVYAEAVLAGDDLGAAAQKTENAVRARYQQTSKGATKCCMITPSS